MSRNDDSKVPGCRHRCRDLHGLCCEPSPPIHLRRWRSASPSARYRQSGQGLRVTTTDDEPPAVGDDRAFQGERDPLRTRTAPSGPIEQSDEVENLTARVRLAWSASRERRIAAWVTAPAAAVAAFAGIALMKFVVRPTSDPAEYLAFDSWWWILGLGAAVFAGVVAYLLSRRTFAGRWIDRQRLGQQAEKVRLADQGVHNEASPEFAALWRATQARLDYYHQIATSQSQRSFKYGQMAAVAGFAVVVMSAVAAALSSSTGAAIAAAITGVAGGGLGGYIGATFMRSQESATLQLRAYFDQPLELSRMLAAERLLDDLDEAHRQESRQEIIRAILAADRAPSIDPASRSPKDNTA